MSITSNLYICENPNGEPHATGMVQIALNKVSPELFGKHNGDIPWDVVAPDDLKKHKGMNDIWQATSAAERHAIIQRGVFALTSDYTYKEQRRDGLGLIVTNVDASRMKTEYRAPMADWMRLQYGATITNDAQLDAAIADKRMGSLLRTDMSASGMSFDTLVNVFHAQHKKPLRFTEHFTQDQAYVVDTIPDDQRKEITGTLEKRLNLSGRMDDADLKKLRYYYDNTAVKMRDAWPSAKGHNYGFENAREGGAQFWLGANYDAEYVIKSGTHAYSTAWPGNDDLQYDKYGIARDSKGGYIAPKDIIADPDYLYAPKEVISKSFSGKDAGHIIDGLLQQASPNAKTPSYGWANNCVRGASVVFGENGHHEMCASLGLDGTRKVTNAQLSEGIAKGISTAMGFSAHAISIDADQIGKGLDHNLLGAAQGLSIAAVAEPVVAKTADQQKQSNMDKAKAAAAALGFGGAHHMSPMGMIKRAAVTTVVGSAIAATQRLGPAALIPAAAIVGIIAIKQINQARAVTPNQQAQGLGA